MALRGTRSGKWLCHTRFFGNVRYQLAFCDCRSTLRRIISTIQTQLPFLIIVRQWYDHSIQNFSQHLTVVSICSAQHHR